MSKTVNKVQILGHVGKDPDVKVTPGGTVVANFSIATTEREKDSGGNWTDRTEWHNIVTFSKTAEVIRDYVHKGDKIYIEGKLRTQSWNDKNTGEKKYRTEIMAFELVLLGNKPKDAQDDPQSSGSDWDAGFPE